MLATLFLLSGATSLVYQVLWIRQLSLILGSTLYAVSAVVGAFMAGLAVGSVLFGAVADRARRPLLIYALLEAGIGALALAIPHLFALIGGSALASGWMSFALVIGMLFLPTILMGGTLPALARFVAGYPGTRGRLIGGLYALNTAGAVIGAALTGFVLIRTLGVVHTTWIIAAGNFAIAVFAAVLARSWPAAEPAPIAAPKERVERESKLIPAITATYVVNGFVGIALEVLWTRAVLLFIGNSIYAFTIILTTFLLGIAIGSSVMSSIVRRVANAPQLLVGIQCLIGLIVGATPFLLGWIGVPVFEAARERSAPLGLGAQALSGYVVAVLFILPPTLLLGASFPLVARAVADHTSRVGHAVGGIYALNTLGGVLGSLLASILLIPALGIERSILLAAALSAGAGMVLALRARAVGWGRLGGGLLASLLLAIPLAPNHLQAMLERMLRIDLSFYEEGLETTVGVYESREAGRPVLLINNVGLSDRGVVHKMLAHLPALFHPAPERALVLGFGVGISSNSFAAHPLATNDCVEISPEVMEAAPHFGALNQMIASRGDPAFRAHIADGRRFLLAHPEPYDLIALDANTGNLRNAGVGKLYTREFFALCRRRMTPDGMITVYVSPNGTLREFKMITRTFSEVFPHTTLWLDPVYGETCVLLGTMRPLRIDLERYLERIQRPAVQDDLEGFDLDQPGMLLSAFMLGEEKVRLFAQDGELNTDDRPIMEFYPLDMDPFDVDDHPLSEAGLPLFEDSLTPCLETPSEPSAAVREVLTFIDQERRIAPLKRRCEEARAAGDPAAVEWLKAAAGLHPEAEYLRMMLGHGRHAAGAAEAAYQADPSAENQGRLGVIAARREEYARALPLIEAAIAAFPPGNSPGAADRAAWHLEAARAARRTRAFAKSRQHLDAAEQLGENVALDRAELVLQERGTAGAEQIRSLLVAARISTAEVGRILALCRTLRQSGIQEPQIIAFEAGTLETLGDYAGAWSAYGDLRQAAPLQGEVTERERICALLLGLRWSVEQAAHGPEADPAPVLTSSMGYGTVPLPSIPAVDHDRADPWLELSSLYRGTGRPLPAYRMARAARTVDPENPLPYVTVGQTSLALGAKPIAKLAFERAVSLDPSNTAARATLRQLTSS